MPVTTRSCTKQKGRSRIEEDTPVSTSSAITSTRRYPTRSSAKRKILPQDNDNKDLEPPPKRAVNSKSLKNVLKLPKASTIKKGEKLSKAKKSNEKPRVQTSRIPRPCAKEDNPGKPPAQKDTAEKGKERKENTKEQKFNTVAVQHGGLRSSIVIEAVPKTPSGCIAARIRSYSALRRSQKRRKNGHELSVEDKENSCSPVDCIAARIKSYSVVRRNQRKTKNSPDGYAVDEVASSPCYTRLSLKEMNSNHMEMDSQISAKESVRGNEGEVEKNDAALVTDDCEDDDILWKMSRNVDNDDVDNMSPTTCSTDEESLYKKKYLTLVSAMKQLQNNFLRAQQNVERNLKAYNNFVDELKKNLQAEKQKNKLLKEELELKKGTIEGLRNSSVSIKQHCDSTKTEKEGKEKQDNETQEKMKSFNEEVLKTDESKSLQAHPDQQAVINFYSKLTGLVVSCDETFAAGNAFQSFECSLSTQGHSNQCLHFRLTLDKEFDEIEYSPTPKSPGSEAALLNAPECLRENFFFGSDHAPKFLEELLKTIQN